MGRKIENEDMRTSFFKGLKQLQAERDLKKELRVLLESMTVILSQPTQVAVIQEFIHCLPVGQQIDNSRLPYYFEKPFARHETKSECVFALISWLVQRWWDFQKGQKSAITVVILYVNQLRQIRDNGLDKYDIEGDVKQGYWLKERE